MGVFSTHFVPLISILAQKIMEEWYIQLEKLWFLQATVDSYAKTFLISYPSLENSTTPIAITQIKNWLWKGAGNHLCWSLCHKLQHKCFPALFCNLFPTRILLLENPLRTKDYVRLSVEAHLWYDSNHLSRSSGLVSLFGADFLYFFRAVMGYNTLPQTILYT